MPCNLIDLGAVPYDEATLAGVYEADGCDGVAAHFQANPISPGDCIVIDDVPYRVTGVRVKCSGNPVYENGAPATPPQHTHHYNQTPVSVELWLTPMTEEELADCA